MSSLYMGTAASGRKYNSLSACFTDAKDEDVILVNPMENNASYDLNVTFPNDTTIFVKGDVPEDYDHNNILSNSASKAFLSNTSNTYCPNLSVSGVNKTTNVVFESLHLRSDRGMTFGSAQYSNILFNKCRLTIYESDYDLLRYLSRGVVELRNCFIEFINTNQYLSNTMGSGGVVNIVKCTCTDINRINGAGHNSNDRLFHMEIQDAINHTHLVDGYGVGYGKEIITLERPIIGGRILDNGLPVSKPVFLYRKADERRVASTISDDDGYFEFDARNFLLDEMVIVTLKNPSISNDYVIVNDVRPVDPRE